MFYTATSGIWGSVWLEAVPRVQALDSVAVRYARDPSRPGQPSRLFADVTSRAAQMVVEGAVRRYAGPPPPLRVHVEMHATADAPEEKHGGSAASIAGAADDATRRAAAGSDARVGEAAAGAPNATTSSDDEFDGPGNRAGWWSAPLRPRIVASGSCTLPSASWREIMSSVGGTMRQIGAIPSPKAPFGWPQGVGERTATCTADLVWRADAPPPRLWTPETPILYGLVLRLTHADGDTSVPPLPLDMVRSYAGLRTVSLKAKHGVARIALNGRTRFLAGVLDQGYWPEGLYTAPTDAALASDLVAAKALGFDLVRKHAKVEPARWYYHADRLGLLVMQDMPSPPAITCKSSADGDPKWEDAAAAAHARRQAKQSARKSSDAGPVEDVDEEESDAAPASVRAKAASAAAPPAASAAPDAPPTATGGATTAADRAAAAAEDARPKCALDTRGFALELRQLLTWLSWSPSVVHWVVFNEGWGQHDTATLVQLARRFDPTRLITDASGWLSAGGLPVAVSTPPPATAVASRLGTAAPGMATLSDDEFTEGAKEGAKESAPWLQAMTRQAMLPLSGGVGVGHAAPSAPADPCARGACGDVVDVHAYPGPWPRRAHRVRWYGAGAWSRLEWTSSAARASVLGEFGGTRLAVAGHMHGTSGWGYGKASPHDCAGFVRLIGDLWREVAQLPGLSACVWTQLTDVEAEWNGLLTYDRVLKCDELTRTVAPLIREARRALS